ncbi:hypothetical protein COO60DRAFT_1292462 [Scenedesmus sp. NREL 46B-D3]|nr:hypothetical protein COO60DRAFT_1292462 [Scenedesmus sp. NREL 46B-D3]
MLLTERQQALDTVSISSGYLRPPTPTPCFALLQESCTTEPCELDKPEYKTDEFRLYQFKITQCTNEEAHDWCLCPFAHPGAREGTAQGPPAVKYTGISCPDYRKGTCKRGNACPYAHGVFEVWLHPSRYRTQTCKDAPHCTRQVCFFAHTLDEVRAVEPEDLPALLEDGAAADGDIEVPVVPESESTPAKCGSNTNAKAAAAAKAKAAAAAAAAAQAAGSVSESSAASSSSGSSFDSGPLEVGSSSRQQQLQRSVLDVPSGEHLQHCDNRLAAWRLGERRQPEWRPERACAVAGCTAACGVDAGCWRRRRGRHRGGSRSRRQPPAAGAHRHCTGGCCASCGGCCFGTAATLRHVWQPGPRYGSSCIRRRGMQCTPVGLSSSVHAAGRGRLGQHFGSAGNLALAAAAHQAVAAQHQEMQAMLQAAMMRQQPLASMQQHRDAMWTAAYNAAAGVGLNAATAAACADAAVQSTTEAADAAAAAAAHSQQQQQLAVQQLLAAQHQHQQLVHQLAAVTAPMGAGMPGAPLTMQQLQHAGSFGLFGAGVQCDSPAPDLSKLGSSGCLDFDQQQQMAAAPLLMQQAGALAMHCEAFGGSKQLGSLYHQAQGGVGPLQVSVTAGCGGAFGGLCS